MISPGFGKPEDQGWPATETNSYGLYAQIGSKDEETRMYQGNSYKLTTTDLTAMCSC